MEPIHSSFEDDPDMLDIVREFAAELPERVQGLETALEEGDCTQIQHLAHQLKGAGGGYGFPVITETAAALELAVQQAAADGELRERLVVLCDVLRAVVVSEAD